MKKELLTVKELALKDREGAFAAHMVRTQDMTQELLKGGCGH